MQNINAYYINVYCAPDGEIVGSENGIMNTEAKALEEAIRYVLDHDWTYIETLSNHSYPINFKDQILDEEFNRLFPNSEFSRKQCEELRKKEWANIERKTVSVSTGMSCQKVEV
jgi:hypothetical protein